MRLSLSVWFTLALGVGLVGLVVGGVGGLAGALLESEPAEMARIAGLVFWLHLVALPLALWALTDISLDAEENAPLYAAPNRAFAVIILGGIAGALAASGVYFVPATNLPVLLRGADAVAMRVALYAYVGWTQALIVAAVTGAAAAAIAGWAVRRAKAQSRS
jgi:hypothetical protein